MAELVSAALGLTRFVTVVTWLGGLEDEERSMFERAGFVEAPLSPGARSARSGTKQRSSRPLHTASQRPASERYRPGLLVKRLGGDVAPAGDTPGAPRESWRYHPIDSDGF
jgi:hypothetical protein